MLDPLSLYLANFETNKGKGMFLSIDFLLATIAIAIMIACYVILLAKLKPANESSELSKLLQKTYEEMPVQRRMEMLEKVKEERIKEYLNRKKQKLESS
jgi:uncharacterized membrane protein (DUF106 family)